MLDILMVAPAWQRRGLGTALVQSAMNELRAGGERRRRSAYHLANAQSAAWHARFGFREEPGWLLAGHYAALARWEIYRQRLTGELTPESETALKREARKWERMEKRLERIQMERWKQGRDDEA